MIDELLKNLITQQKEGNDKGYLKGIFDSQRFHSFTSYSREDENIFFSSAIVFTLKEYHSLLSNNAKTIADDIIKQVINCYPSFKNFEGKETYNFFKTTPMDFFPNGKIMRHFKFFKLADDADDTAYVYLTDSDNKNHKNLKESLIKHANGSTQWSFHKNSKYKNLKAYGVYFGKNMHLEIDACVLTNILLWSAKNNLTPCEQDNDSIEFLMETITSKDYIKTPHLISPCYPTTAQICYHYSRLIKKEHNSLSMLKLILVEDIQNLLRKRQSFIDKVFYHIALLNLGIKPKKKLNYQLNKVLKETDYFYTSIPLMIPKLWARKLQKHKLLHFFGLRTKCNGYTTTLLLEYELLYQSN